MGRGREQVVSTRLQRIESFMFLTFGALSRYTSDIEQVLGLPAQSAIALSSLVRLTSVDSAVRGLPDVRGQRGILLERSRVSEQQVVTASITWYPERTFGELYSDGTPGLMNISATPTSAQREGLDLSIFFTPSIVCPSEASRLQIVTAQLCSEGVTLDIPHHVAAINGYVFHDLGDVVSSEGVSSMWGKSTV